MTHHTQTVWNQDFHFTSKVNDQEVHFDATALPGEHNNGVSPKQIILSGLAGCTGMDVVALLQKRYKVAFSDFKLDVSGELTDTHPKYYHKIHLVYSIKVAEADRPMVEEAIQQSLDKYCGVHAMLAEAADITHEVQFL